MVKSILLAILLSGAGVTAALATDTIVFGDNASISIGNAVKGTNTGYVIQGGYSAGADGSISIAEHAKANLKQIGHANTGAVIQIADHTSASVKQIVISHHHGR